MKALKLHDLDGSVFRLAEANRLVRVMRVDEQEAKRQKERG